MHWRNVTTAARSTKQTATLKLMLMQLKLKTSFYDPTNLHWWFTLATKFWVESYLWCWGNLNHKKSAFKIKDFHGTFESICNVLHFQKYNLTRLKKQTDQQRNRSCPMLDGLSNTVKFKSYQGSQVTNLRTILSFTCLAWGSTGWPPRRPWSPPPLPRRVSRRSARRCQQIHQIQETEVN